MAREYKYLHCVEIFRDKFMTENEAMPRYDKLKNNQTEEPWGNEKLHRIRDQRKYVKTSRYQ